MSHGRYRTLDEDDLRIQSWAYQWVRMFVRDPDRASAYIGPLGCSLGRIRELHDGAASSTSRGREWPEGFLGAGLVVAVALRYMDLAHREILGVHYVARCYDLDTGDRLSRPHKVRVMACRLGLSLAEYFNRKEVAKGMVHAAFVLEPNVLARARGLPLPFAQAAELPPGDEQPATTSGSFDVVRN